jgi:hypothetical protein
VLQVFAFTMSSVKDFLIVGDVARSVQLFYFFQVCASKSLLVFCRFVAAGVCSID